MAQAGSVYGAAFKACVITAVYYKIYAVQAEPEDGTSEGDILQKAEVALRRSGRTVFVSLSPSRRELWSFRLVASNDLDGSDSMSEALTNGAVSGSSSTVSGGVPDFELALDPAMQTVAQGVFLPPFTVTPDISTNEGDPRSYRPLLRAIEARCLDALLKEGDRELYEAFGPSAVLNTMENSLTRVSSVLQHDGTLVIKLTSQQCRLRRLQPHSTRLSTPHVWLLPHGIPGRVFPSQRYEDFVERPNKQLARALYAILNSHFVTNVDLESLERSTWLRVSSFDVKDLLWPAILVTEVNPASYGVGDPDDAYRPLARIEKPDPYTNLAEAMAMTRRQGMMPQEADPELGVATLHQTMHPPLAPPPSPRQHHIPASVPPSSVSSTGNIGPGAHTAAGSLAPSAAATAAPTPTASGPHHAGQPHVPAIYPTPIYHTPAMSTPAAANENWLDVVDEDEVGDADFNFFDLPVPSHTSPLFRLPEPQKIKEEPDIGGEPVHEAAVASQDFTPQRRDPPKWSSRAQFSMLELNSSDLDAKYSSGGHFFVPPPDSSDSSGTEESSAEPDDEGEEDDDDEADENTDMIDAELGNMNDDDADFGLDSVPAAVSEQFIVEDSVEMWLKSLRNVSPPASSTDATRLASFRQLIPQLVYDGGLLSDLLEAPMATGQTETVCASVVNRVKRVFPGLRRYSILESSGGSSTDRLQLLSPPLVLFKRNGMLLKARISIIKFWRLMGLSPLTQVEGGDVSVILVTLSSPTVISGAHSLLSALKTMYEGGNLGHLDLPTFGDVHEGLLTISADLRHTSGETVGDLYETACAQLKHQLQHHFHGKNLVLITACPTSRRGGLLTSGVAFQLALGFGAVRTACPDAQWILCSLDSLVSRYNHDIIPTQFDAMRLALLVHARLTPSKAAFQLAGLAPQSVGLQFSALPPTYLLDDEPVMHIAYLIWDRRWVFVAWSDQWARMTQIDVLRLADHHDKADRALHSVFSEIWARTIALTKSSRPKWRFCIAKCGAMDTAESLVWRRVVAPKREATDSVAHCLMDIPHPRGLAVNDDRPIRHTAQPQSQPPFEVVDSVIVDSTNETYGIAMSSTKAGVSSSADQITTAYLLQPTPQGHMQLEIRLILVQGLPGTPQKVMTRVLGQFRRLASHAESRGISDENTIVPWHALAVAKLEAAAIEMGL